MWAGGSKQAADRSEERFRAGFPSREREISVSAAPRSQRHSRAVSWLGSKGRGEVAASPPK